MPKRATRQSRAPPFICTHVVCTTEAGARFEGRDSKTLNAHEKTTRAHRLCPRTGTPCQACQLTGNIDVSKQWISCGHEKCGLAYKSEKTKKQHEKEEHMKCSNSCQLCKEHQHQEKAKQQKAAMKKNREEEERERKRKREEEKDEAIELANKKMKEVDPAVGHIKLEVAKAAVEGALCNEPWMPPIDKLQLGKRSKLVLCQEKDKGVECNDECGED